MATATAVPTHPHYSTTASPGISDGLEYPDGNRSGLADYVTIATAALNRGFRVTPVHPLEKRGILYNWNKQPTTTLSEVLQHAKDFPNHNVGIVGRRGVGNHCFLDIDAEGVTERIEQETGQRMPLTYTVCSRPQSAPWKRHFYFTQTSYSVSRLKKEANRKDVTRQVLSDNGTLMHPTMYDLKGVGGGGLVVAAGSVRKDGEIYTVLNDVPVVEIPSWLVDWLVEDLAGYRSACAKERYERAMKVAAMPEEERATRRQMGDESAFDISEPDIYEFLNWRAFQFAAMGAEGKLLEKVLFQQVQKFCAGGKKFLESDGGKRQIHKAAANKRLPVGNAGFFNRLGQKKRAALGGRLIPAAPPTRKSLMVAAMHNFPDTVTSEDGYSRLQKALTGTGFTVDNKTKAGQKAVQETRKVAGFHAYQTPSGWIWSRCKK
ncbi:MAG TPA: bifunctional DNA primase/polymerase [Candidatus Sulfotelmatobacter sp.]|nr:bifunctional DNA primase/polymerase [Candidatus Sulfotelmatobacter sp.]